MGKPAHYIMQRTDNVKRLPTKHSVPTVRVCVQHLNIFKTAIYMQQNVPEYGEQGIHFIVLHSGMGP